MTGAGFPFYRGKGAKLQRGLIRFFLEQADAAGYEEFIPPHMINPDSGFGTGQLPDKRRTDALIRLLERFLQRDREKHESLPPTLIALMLLR